MSDPTFKNVKFFLLSFKNGANNSRRRSFSLHYVLLVEIKCLNVLIGNKPVFDEPVKKKQEAYEKLVEMSRNGDSTTRKLLDYLYHQKYYRLIVIDSSRQRYTSIPQQVIFLENLMVLKCFLSLKTTRHYSRLLFRFI